MRFEAVLRFVAATADGRSESSRSVRYRHQVYRSGLRPLIMGNREHISKSYRRANAISWSTYTTASVFLEYLLRMRRVCTTSVGGIYHTGLAMVFQGLGAIFELQNHEGASIKLSTTLHLYVPYRYNPTDFLHHPP